MPSSEQDITREMWQLAAAHPVARLGAIHELGTVLQEQLADWIDEAELKQVKVARRSYRPQATWAEIGRALGVTHTQARRRFADRV